MSRWRLGKTSPCSLEVLVSCLVPGRWCLIIAAMNGMCVLLVVALLELLTPGCLPLTSCSDCGRACGSAHLLHLLRQHRETSLDAVATSFASWEGTGAFAQGLSQRLYLGVSYCQRRGAGSTSQAHAYFNPAGSKPHAIPSAGAIGSCNQIPAGVYHVLLEEGRHVALNPVAAHSNFNHAADRMLVMWQQGLSTPARLSVRSRHDCMGAWLPDSVDHLACMSADQRWWPGCMASAVRSITLCN
jgi:hypothetical protein